MIIVNGWKPLTIITKRSILNVAAVLDPPLFGTIFFIFISLFPDIHLVLINCNLFRFLNRFFLLVCELFLPIFTCLLIVYYIRFYMFTSRFYSFLLIYQLFSLVYQSFLIIFQSLSSRFYSFTSEW